MATFAEKHYENHCTYNEISLMYLGLYETAWIIERDTFHGYEFVGACNFYSTTVGNY